MFYIIVKDQVSHANETTGIYVMPYSLNLMLQIMHEKVNVTGLNSGRKCPNLFCTLFLYPLKFDWLRSLSYILTFLYVQSILFMFSYCNFYSKLRSQIMKIQAVLRRARGSTVGWGTAVQVRRSRVRFPKVSLEFFIDIILPAALWPWGRLSL